MEGKYISTIGKQTPLKDKIIRNIQLDMEQFSGEDCLEYFMLRSQSLQKTIDRSFEGKYNLENLGNEHVFELSDRNYSVKYSIDDRGVFKVTEIVPTEGSYNN